MCEFKNLKSAEEMSLDGDENNWKWNWQFSTWNVEVGILNKDNSIEVRGPYLNVEEKLLCVSEDVYNCSPPLGLLNTFENSTTPRPQLLLGTASSKLRQSLLFVLVQPLAE
jgi:hypothetical protein